MINIIAAIAKNRAIGFQNKLIYWLPNDLKRFKALTTGNTIIMGRKTFESLPKGALPNRRNIVISRNPDYQAPGAEVFTSLEAAIAASVPTEAATVTGGFATESLYIIGGEQLYKAALPLANRLCLTEIDDTPTDADAFFPEFDGWREISRENHDIDEKHAFRYSFVDYEREESTSC